MINDLLLNLNKLHTTKLGADRIKKNLYLDSLDENETVEWCRTKIKSSDAVIKKQGKNWYVETDDCLITVNSYSFTIITAHSKRR